eukprot:Gregarina_sp_Poly_1__3333@NODE_195_length_11596_cov_85_481395_g174_i0_p4_GENE_NODE_195_length_11596_cov_85_481395_g174_i0NODE_195_length_11596_cov_85_481395_g174_i0_p4_ORF_typecomplete_len270_score47_00FHA/PF00498_26/4_2e03FHA/PF00498_26/9_1e14YopYscD_cpl/PF16697_5/4_2e03YopYscD_cpl/PF16697_5/1_2e05YopYscD_cpl/PF16697_5/3_6e03FHA_2/PF17913_1/0_0097_NODE_195_length_11596_cov_85_481395_g174_i015212330
MPQEWRMRRARVDSDDSDGVRAKKRKTERDGDKYRDAPEASDRGARNGSRSFPREPRVSSTETFEVRQKREHQLKQEIAEDVEKLRPQKKIEPDFKPSGVLAEETNMKNGVLVKFTVPFEARKPTKKWKLFVFKSTSEQAQCIRIDYQRWFLIGKDVRVVDIPMVHPTISKQHAAICHQVTEGGDVKPFIWDLESTNGTFLNDFKLEPNKQYELREKDILKFAKSSREYVVLHDDLVQTEEVSLEDVLEKNLEQERKDKLRNLRRGRYW